MRDADLRAGHCTVDTGNLINNIIGRRACSTALLATSATMQNPGRQPAVMLTLLQAKTLL